MRTRSQRIIDALRQLEQFKLAQGFGSDCAVNVLTGARVEPVPDPGDEGHGMLEVTFPGGVPITVIGDLYLDLQMIESVRIELDSSDSSTIIGRRVASLSEHLNRKHDLA